MYGSHDGNGMGGMRGMSEPDEPLEHCADVSARLDAYHDGLLPAEDAHAVASHVAGCAHCAARLAALAAADQLIRSAPAPRVGPELRQHLYRRIAAARGARLPSAPIRSISELTMNDSRSNLPRAAVPSRSPRRLSVLLSGIAAALIVALLVGVFVMQGHGARHGGPTVASGHTPTTTGACAPNAARTKLPANAHLSDIALTSASEGWAVGAFQNPDSSWAKSLILHYTGCQWTQVGPVIPNVGLWSISMDSATDGWIVGGGEGSGSVALHYTGGKWQQVQIAALNNTNSTIQVVRMLSATDGWMVVTGTKNAQGLLSTSLLHDANGTWSAVGSAPLSDITDVAPVGPDDAWVIGVLSDNNPTGMLAHYQGGRWVATTSLGTAVDSSHLTLRMQSPTDGWAMAEVPAPDGNYFEGVESALVLHYDGTAWKPVNTGANPAAQRVRVFGDGEAWAFALTNHRSIADPGNLTVTLAQYESGGTWHTVKMPATAISDIAGLSQASAGEYWAIGITETMQPNPNDTTRNTSMGVYSYVLLHFVNGAWTEYGK